MGRPGSSSSSRRFAAGLTALGALTLGALLGGCGAIGGAAGTSRASPDAAIPPRLLSEARPIGRGPRFHPPARGPVPGACRPVLGPRHGVHVELFAANRVVVVAEGIGVRGPVTRNAGRISNARCYGDLVTLEPTGVVLLRPGRRLVLADLFRAWGEPLSRQRAASFPAPRADSVRVYAQGQLLREAPGTVRLRAHGEVVVEVGPHVPPHHSYTFPPGV